MSRRRFPRTVGIVAAVYLAAMAVVFALLAEQNIDFGRSASRTEGTVVALVARAPLGSAREPRAGSRSPSLAPQVSYVVDGRTYSYVAAHGRYRQRLQVGDKVTVLYAPTDPSSARLSGEGQNLAPVLSAGFGVAAVLVLLLSLRLGRAPAGRGRPTGTARGRASAAPVVAD